MTMTSRVLRVAVVCTAVVITAALLPHLTAGVVTPRQSMREIRLDVRDMTFHLEGREDPNPTLRMKQGERIRVVLMNRDRGMSHDFAISAWQVATRPLAGEGHDAIEFTVPEVRGSSGYVCTTHSAIMRGIIEVD